jgi:hypothetical protein
MTIPIIRRGIKSFISKDLISIEKKKTNVTILPRGQMDAEFQGALYFYFVFLKSSAAGMCGNSRGGVVFNRDSLEVATIKRRIKDEHESWRLVSLFRSDEFAFPELELLQPLVLPTAKSSFK